MRLQVVAARTKEKDGYTAVQLGWGSAKVKNVSQAEQGPFRPAKVEPKQKLVEFRVAETRCWSLARRCRPRISWSARRSM